MIAACAVLVSAVLCLAGVADSSSVESLVRQYAPRVWLHSDEEFFPMSVSEFLTQVTPTIVNCTSCAYPSTQLPLDSDSDGYYLMANGILEDLYDDKTSFLHGHSPATKSSTVHAFVNSCDSTGGNFVVTYWFFYPCDKGKTVMDFGSTRWLKKLLENQNVGAHVGDMERMSVEFKNGVPQTLFLSVHSIGLFYTFDSASNTFKYSHSKTKSVQTIENPPEAVQIVDGHPVIYAAEGSHGVWGAAGSHSYTEYDWISFLSDEGNEGTSWDTWQDLSIHYLDDSASLPEWYRYLGYWGNPKTSCMTVPLVNLEVCKFSTGPSCIASRESDFSCS